MYAYPPRLLQCPHGWIPPNGILQCPLARSQDMDQFPGSDIFMCEYVYDESFKVRSPG